jgi:hypothetical protein
MLGVSLHSWENAMVIFLIIAGFFALIAGVATWAVVKLQRVEIANSNREFDEYKIESARQIAQANAAGEAAKAAAAKANVRAAELEKESASLEEDNLSLQISMRPRRLSFIGWADHPEKIADIYEPLKKFAGTTAFIQVVPDFEAGLFAQDVSQVLTSVGWKPQFVTEAQSHMPDLSFPEGTTLFTLTDGKSVTEAGTAFWSALNDADVMMSGTGTFGAYTFHEILDKRKPGYPYFDPPLTAVFIRVGVKPFTAQFVEIQRRNMERQDRKFDRGLRAAYERTGQMSFAVPGHPPIAVKPGPNGAWIAINPDEQYLVPRKATPTLVLPGVMLRSSPPPDKQ